MSSNKEESVLREKSYAFSIRIVRLAQMLTSENKEFVLSKQILKSGTSIGALVYEAEFAQSRADFVNKLSIALKETNETKYWLNLLKDTEYIQQNLFESLIKENEGLIKILVSSVKTSKRNN